MDHHNAAPNRSSVHLAPELPPLPEGAGLRAVQAVARLADLPPGVEAAAWHAARGRANRAWRDRVAAAGVYAPAAPPAVAPIREWVPGPCEAEAVAREAGR